MRADAREREGERRREVSRSRFSASPPLSVVVFERSYFRTVNNYRKTFNYNNVARFFIYNTDLFSKFLNIPLKSYNNSNFCSFLY